MKGDHWVFFRFDTGVQPKLSQEIKFCTRKPLDKLIETKLIFKMIFTDMHHLFESVQKCFFVRKINFKYISQCVYMVSYF